MRYYIFVAVLVIAVVVIECRHTFLGTNVLRKQVFHKEYKFRPRMYRKRVQNLTFTMPASYGFGKSIQGILAYDKNNSDASANVTAGGLGFNYVTLRMNSGRGDDIKFDVYIYA